MMTLKKVQALLLALTVSSPTSSAFLKDADSPYQLKSNVDNTLKLALDIADMRGAGDDFAKKKQIYTEGQNALPETLQELSLTAETRWPLSPMYNIYRHGFAQIGVKQENDKAGEFDGAPATQYADRLVQDLFDLEISHIEAEGTLVFSVLMAFWSLLSDVLGSCWSVTAEQKSVSAENARMFEFLDNAVALWVGEGQVRGQTSTGSMLYNLAQVTGERFNQDEGDGEVKINKEMLTLFLGLQKKIEDSKCSTQDGYKQIRQEVQLLVSYSNTVLVQMLLHRILEDQDKQADFVEMYTLAIIPQIATCNEHAYETLMSIAVAQSVTVESAPTIIKTLQDSYSCLNIECSLVGGYEGDRIPVCDDSPAGGLPGLLDYLPLKDVRKKSYIDRDIRQIGVFLELEAFDNAKDWFLYGWNSDVTLDTISENQDNTEVSLYLQYFTQDTYLPAKLLTDAFDKLPPFNTATNAERSELIISVLQSTVMYWAVVEELYDADQACRQGDLPSAEVHWDTAAAYYIGSAEGDQRYGQEGGSLLFSVAKDFCAAFGTCEPGSSEAARQVIASLKTGQGFIKDGECQPLESLLATALYPGLRLPLVQGTIYHASKADKASTLAYSRAILPAVNDKSPTMADIINTNTNFFFEPATIVDFPSIVSSFQSALELMSTNCAAVGDIMFAGASFGFCPGDLAIPAPTASPVAVPTSPVSTDAPTKSPVVQIPPPTTSPTSSPVAAQPTASPTVPITNAPIYVPNPHPQGIAWGAYEFSSEQAEKDSLFSLDVKKMYHATSPSDAELVYNQTSASAPQGLFGITSVRSLADFSTKASAFMSEDPMYNFYRIALFDDMSFDDAANADGWSFAHSVVRLALAPTNGNDQVLGAKAVVVMNVWMLIANRLYEATRECREGYQPVDLIDAAVALWIGQEQARDRFDSGWMIYSLAQEAFQLYGNSEKEAPVNTKLLELFVTAKQKAELCATSNESGFRELRFLVDEIVRSLTIPLLQSLLYYMSVDDFEYVELFALSFAPQAVACNEGTYRTLRDTLYEGFKRDEYINSPAFIPKMGELLHCLGMTCGDLGDVTFADTHLEQLVNELCAYLNAETTQRQIAGYKTSPGTDLMKIDRIDLDIHQMDLFSRVGAYGLAADVYQYGRNSIVSEFEWLSIGKLADELSIIGPADMVAMYSTYYKQPTYAAADIIAAFAEGEGSRFAGASRRQLSEITFRAPQALISFMLVIGKLRAAIGLCRSGGNGQGSLDEAVALFVGSMEGRFDGGDASNNGKMLYALAKEVCETFGMCVSNNAKSNAVAMAAFTDIQARLNINECDAAESVIETSIVPMMKVSLIQGTLYFANLNEALAPQGSNATLTSGDILAKSIIPLVNAVDENSAAVIVENMEFSRSRKPVEGGLEAVVKAFAKVLSGMNVECTDIGPIRGLQTCGGNVGPPTEEPPGEPAPAPETPTNLGDDLYVTTTYVQDRANIALDIKDMEEELEFGNVDQARLVYEEGKNSEVFDSLGVRTALRSLAGFSTGATVSNPLYTVAVYALQDADGKYLGKEAWHYADTIVQRTLDSATAKSTLGAEAAVALNVWMELANELFSTVERCKDNRVRDEDGVKSIDEAVAYWIGDGQIAGDPTRGHLLYNLAEQMGTNFNLAQTGQSRTNVNILRLFHQAKIELSLPDACAERATAHRVQHIVNKIVTQMVTVNVQALIHYLREEDHDAVRVYAHAVVPLVAACSPDAFSYLRTKLIDDSAFPAADVEEIIQRIYSTFPCFGMQCDDVGVHKTETRSTCEDPPPRPSIAGYTPSSAVEEYAQLDLDILELGILMDMGAYKAAEDLYTFGKHVPTAADAGRTALSLQYLARRTSGSTVPQIGTFQRYFGNDVTYADTLVKAAFNNNDGNSRVQRRIIATGVCRFMVMFAAALEEMKMAVDSCKAGGVSKQEDSSEAWDRVAAFVIGHLEGSKESGSADGLLFWGIAKKNCFEFDTCSTDVSGSSVINDKISTLLYAGRGAIIGGNCAELEKASGEIVPLLQTSLVQASLSSVTKLANRGLPSEELRAEAHVYALSLLPLIDETNREGAIIIRSNMGIEGQAIPAGAAAVASAYSRSLNGLGVDCREVGVSPEVNACTGVVSSSSNTAAIIAGTVVGGVALIFLLFLCGRRGRKVKKKKKEEDKVEFIPSKGELNHITDLNLEEQEARNKDAETDFLTGNDADAAIADEHYDDYDDDYDEEYEGEEEEEVPVKGDSPEASDSSEIV